MTKTLLLIACLGAASPAFSQTHVYTRADLGRPLSSNRATVTAEQWASLVAHQFHAPRAVDGPTVTIIGAASEIAGATFYGPFGAFPPIPPPRRLDGTSFDQPAWSVSTYLGYGHGLRYGAAGHHQGGPTRRDGARGNEGSGRREGRGR